MKTNVLIANKTNPIIQNISINAVTV